MYAHPSEESKYAPSKRELDAFAYLIFTFCKTPSGGTVRIYFTLSHKNRQPFKEGRQSVNSDPRSGRPSTSRIEDKITQVKAVVRSDRRLTVREIAQECQISVGSCDEILRKNLNMRRVSAKFVPRLLIEDQQFQRLVTSLSQDQEHLKRTPVSGHCNHKTEFDTAASGDPKV
ncbi:HTH_48 domain-containing protein [Trichonephila clavipes]|nr:HTH_48 domain-containing protein [Trichonephila clavipes]